MLKVKIRLFTIGFLIGVLGTALFVDLLQTQYVESKVNVSLEIPKMPEAPKLPPIPKPPKKVVLEQEYKLLVATVYGEAEGTSLEAKKAVASTIINRTTLKWNGHSTVTKVIKHTGYDAAKFKNWGFKKASKYLSSSKKKPIKEIDQLVAELQPIYYEKKTTTKAIFYYSPKAQARFHKKKPSMYKKTPAWAKSTKLMVVRTDIKDDFKFYAIKKK